MKVDKISYAAAYVSSAATADQIRETLEKLAAQHNTTVDQLVASAKSAGSSGAPYLVRALNLSVRLEKLEQ